MKEQALRKFVNYVFGRRLTVGLSRIKQRFDGFRYPKVRAPAKISKNELAPPSGGKENRLSRPGLIQGRFDRLRKEVFGGSAGSRPGH